MISHACVTPVNQDLFARVQRLTGWELTLVLPRSWKTEYGRKLRAERLPSLEAKLRPLPVALRGNIPLHFYLASLSRVFADERPDAIYVQHDPHALATMQAFRANARAGAVPIGFKNEQDIPKRYPWPIRRGERFVYRNAAFAIAHARAGAEALRAKGYRGPLRIVPYGVDPSVYRPLGTHPRRADSLMVGYLGRLAPEKGVDTLIRALALTPDRIRSVMVGSGDAEAELRALASSLGVAGRVEWRGYVDHDAAPRAYAEMDLLVVPSRTTAGWREQFGRVVIEALACGVPVCSSDSGEPPNLIEETGGGWTFHEGSPEELAERLRWADANREKLRRTADSGRARVGEAFSADAVAASLADAVRSYALEGSGDPALRP